MKTTQTIYQIRAHATGMTKRHSLAWKLEEALAEARHLLERSEIAWRKVEVLDGERIVATLYREEMKFDLTF